MPTSISPRAARARARRAVAAWNRDHKPGVRVVARLDDRKLDTVTRSTAWDANGHAVVLLVGVDGGYPLARVTAMKTAEAKS